MDGAMKEMTMDDVKAVSLDVLQEFHDFCEANGLRYSLGFGTLLGAIRHKGFIPWDDDVDVVMPRPDYERFFELYRNTSDFAAIDHHHGGALIAFGRLCDMKRTCVDSSVARWTEGETGVGIKVRVQILDKRCIGGLRGFVADFGSTFYT